MVTFIQKGNRTIAKLDVPTELKRKVGCLLNKLMKEYGVKGKSKEFSEGFKDTFKSNLYVLLDNQYHDTKKRKV